MTWTPWGTRQWASAVCAVLPVATVVLVYFPPTGTVGLHIAPAIALFLSAILYQTSGSFLHLVLVRQRRARAVGHFLRPEPHRGPRGGGSPEGGGVPVP